MKNILLALAATATLFSMPAYAANKAFPLGFDLGTATCTDIYKAKQNEWRFNEPAISNWSAGTLLQVPYPVIPGLDGASDLFIVCDTQDKSLYIGMTIPKNSVQQIANGLDNKYRQVQRNLPGLGNGRAKWTASNANIAIEYVHVSFSASLTYQTDESIKLYNKYEQELKRNKQQETASQL